MWNMICSECAVYDHNTKNCPLHKSGDVNKTPKPIKEPKMRSKLKQSKAWPLDASKV